MNISNFEGKPPIDYKKAWKQVDSLINEGLPKSALEIVTEIYENAEKENNTDQKIRSVIYQFKLKNEIEEGSFKKMLTELETQAQTAKTPEKQFLHTMAADLYMMYYRNEIYTISSRSKTLDFDEKDIETYSIDDFARKIEYHIKQSLTETDKTTKEPLTKYPNIIKKGTKPEILRPSLYDFLAAKAIDFYSNSSINITKPADYFEMKENFYFASAKEFANKKIETQDTASFLFNAIKIYQDIIKYHIEDGNTAALIDFDLSRILFVYNNSVNPDKDSLYITALYDLEKKAKKDFNLANIKYRIAEYYYQAAKKTSDKNSETYFYFKKAKELCEYILKKYPKTEGATYAADLLSSVLRRYLKGETEEYIPAKEVFPVLVAYKNIPKIYVRVASIDKNKLEKIRRKYYDREKTYDKLFKAAQKVKDYEFELPLDGSFQQHSTELLIDGLELGDYIIFISTESDFSYKNANVSYGFLKVTNIALSHQETFDGGQRLRITHRKTGQPLKNITVKTYISYYDYRKDKQIRNFYKQAKTDENGICVFEYDGKNWSRDVEIEIITNQEIFSPTRVSLYNRQNEPNTTLKMFLFTDRKIYRPGQTLYFKGILVEKDKDKSKLLENRKTKVELLDPNYTKIAETTLITNDYGSIAGSFTIPTGLLNGNFILQTDYGSINIYVEEYKRPTFEVKMLPFAGNYRLGDTVKITGNAKTYSGANLTDAKVKYNVVRKVRWWGWWYWNVPESSVEIANGTLTTDENGNFDISFVAKPDLSRKKSPYLAFDYEINAVVTDLNGENQTVNATISVGYRSMIVNTEIKDYVNLKDHVNCKILTYNLNGQQIQAKGNITVYKLKDFEDILRDRPWQMPDTFIYTKQQWYDKYPGNTYKNEYKISELPVDKKIKTINFDTRNSRNINIDFVKNYGQGFYLIQINTKDAFGQDIIYKKFITLYNTENTDMPGNILDWFVPVKTICEPGDTAIYNIGTALKNVNILYQIEHKGKIIHTQNINLSNKKTLIKIPVKEEYRGNIAVHFIFNYNNRVYTHSDVIVVPYTNKKLDLKFESFRDKLYPGQQETWKVKITDCNAEKVAAEMIATVYDASLDAFAANNWNFYLYKNYFIDKYWRVDLQSLSYYYEINNYTVNIGNFDTYLKFPEFNWYGYYYRNYRRRILYMKKIAKEPYNPLSYEAEEEKPEVAIEARNSITFNDVGETPPMTDTTKPIETNKLRTNFNETAFFYPQLETDQNGTVTIKFTIPESLTRWKMMGFAHTKDLKYGFLTEEFVTRKDLMVMPNMPRFLREGDNIIITTKIANLSDKKLNGYAELEFYDAITNKKINIISGNIKQNFEVDPEKNTAVSWTVKVPYGHNLLIYKVKATAGKFTDGEQKYLPVLSNRMLVTESMPLPMRAKQTKTFVFEKLKNNKSKTLVNYKYTIEYTSNPAWTAIQALPYLAEYPYECNEQLFNRFYANSIATNIVNSSPEIKRVFDAWKQQGSDALISNLEKNQELKAVLLEQTPWVMEGKDETQRKQRVALLFDLNKMSYELNNALQKLKRRQYSNGSWPWFDGMKGNRYITQYIVAGFGHLKKLGIQYQANNTIDKAIIYIDRKIVEEYNDLKRNFSKKELNDNHLSYMALHYLYARSFFLDTDRSKKTEKAYQYYLNQTQKYWNKLSLYSKGLAALVLWRNGKKEAAKKIIKSLKEYSITHEELGMYWKNNTAGYFWYQAPIETQALMIEVFDEVANDTKSVEELKIWLLKQKQVQNWSTTKATADACYALLMTGAKFYENNELVTINIGDKTLDPANDPDIKTEAGTGYFKISWDGSQVKNNWGEITVKNPNNGIAWGAAYWQYFEDLDKITPHKTPLYIKKKLFKEIRTKTGKAIVPVDDKHKLTVGDKVTVRIEIRVDRTMEYVHMKDMRASAFEPVEVFSGYKYQDGLGYYQSIKDASIDFFFDYLPKGTYVFEYSLFVTNKGDFSNGITQIQCMYAPEFTSHSKGVRVKVE